MAIRLTTLFTIILLVISAVCASSAEMRELYRIRVANTAHGTVSVSPDGGSTYLPVGSVVRPATTTAKGYLASIYASPGTVAATAVHGIRIKFSGERESSKENSQIFSILPREFATSPKGFGGHTAGSSGICTDIPTGAAIFRNLAPFVGNPVYRMVGDNMVSLADGSPPTEGEVFLIVVSIPVRYPTEITFENRVGGKVEAVYPDGRETIAKVERPVTGVGRFDATGYTGIGRINTNHTGVLTISTAPIAKGGKDGSSVETRGGFMIIPSRHAKTILHTPQVMVVGPTSKDVSWLEGSPPLFSGYIGLADDGDENSFRVDVKTSNAGWMPLPTLIGKRDYALMKLPNGAGEVTHIRLCFPKLSPEWIKAYLEKYSREYIVQRQDSPSPGAG